MVLSVQRVAGRGLKTLSWIVTGSLILAAVLNFAFARSFSGMFFSFFAIIVILALLLLLRIPYFYRKTLAPSEIRSVQVGPETSLLEGYGFRLLGKARRGLLVGGPSVSISTTTQEILVSCADPEVLSQKIQEFAGR